MLPVTACWHGRGVVIVAGGPIEPGEGSVQAAALVRWLEQYLTENPGEVLRPIVSPAPLGASRGRRRAAPL
jgi:hypothetical protein